jgi:cyclophilin family peptidyl-prolyl cis-trans isomerase
MIRPRGVLIALLASLLSLASCSGPAHTEKKTEASAQPAGPPTTGAYKVLLATSKGDITVEVHRDWAPIGAQHFYDLVQDGYYNGARFFRYVPNYVIQFGLAADPQETKKWDDTIKDDDVVQTNRAGTLAFANTGAKNSRAAQVFFNLRSNQNLDQEGFAPFAQVVSGMDVVGKIYGGYGENPDQDSIRLQGNAYLLKSYPKLDYIKTARVL